MSEMGLGRVKTILRAVPGEDHGKDGRLLANSRPNCGVDLWLVRSADGGCHVLRERLPVLRQSEKGRGYAGPARAPRRPHHSASERCEQTWREDRSRKNAGQRGRTGEIAGRPACEFRAIAVVTQ